MNNTHPGLEKLANKAVKNDLSLSLPEVPQSCF